MRKGYLLTDAMIVVFLTAMMALVTSAALPAAGHTDRAVQTAFSRAEEDYAQGIGMIPECILCTAAEETAGPE